MLKGLDPRLNADVLHALAAMGHGDTVVLVDTNFPADSVAAGTVCGEVLRMENLTLTEAAEAVLSVLPLDSFVEDHAAHMQVVGSPGDFPEVLVEVQAVIDAAEGQPRPMVGHERFAFYDAAREAYAVIRTGERRFYGNVIFRKGVIGPDGAVA